MSSGSPFEPFPRDAGDVSLCAGCAPDGRCRLGISAMRLDGDHLVAEVSCPPEQRSGPGTAHGGWIAAVFDDVLGELPLRLHTVCVTATLNVEYRQPVPVGQALRVDARVVERTGRRWNVAGELVLPEDGSVLARATGLFVQPDPGHFERHRTRTTDLG